MFIISIMKKALAIVLIFLTLLPSVGLSIGTHICGGEETANKIIFDVNSLQCDMKMEMAKTACPLHPAKDVSDTT